MNLQSISRYISLILRHKPEVINITLNEHGWANVEELIQGIAKNNPGFNKEILEEIVRTDNKQRYSFNDDKTLIRANQGHSIPVDVELEEKEPPRILYHGTGEKYIASIDQNGLIPKSRLYVHLSKDVETAKAVGKRHGKEVVYSINKEDLKNTTELIINREELPISGTMLRTLMIQDKRREWMTFVNPKLHKMYDEIRSELMESIKEN